MSDYKIGDEPPHMVGARILEVFKVPDVDCVRRATIDIDVGKAPVITVEYDLVALRNKHGYGIDEYVLMVAGYKVVKDDDEH